MQKLSNIKLISVVTKLLVLLLIAKIISLALWWYLPSEGIELNVKESYQAKYQRVSFKNMLMKAKVVEQAKVQQVTKTAYSINSLVLKGLYGNKLHGYAIVAKKVQIKKTSIIGVGEEYGGYKLKMIELNQVIFTRAGKDYTLALESKKPRGSSKVSRVQRKQVQNQSDESQQVVTRADINRYSRNPSQIWKDIAIGPVKKRGKIIGFRVKRIRAGSKMATLGLKKGDLIIKANNVRLASFNDALKLYKNINKIDTIALVVERNHEEKEIIYEIR